MSEISGRALTLDAASGHRMMWRNKQPPLTVFMDIRLNLNPPPDVIGSWENCPFRSVFGVVIFDPPHVVRSGGYDERFALHRKYGAWGSKLDAIVAIAKAQKEFARIARRLCFKWCETRDGPTLWSLLPLFDRWKEIYRREQATRGHGTIRARTFWVTFILEDR